MSEPLFYGGRVANVNYLPAQLRRRAYRQKRVHSRTQGRVTDLAEQGVPMQAWSMESARRTISPPVLTSAGVRRNVSAYRGSGCGYLDGRLQPQDWGMV